MNSDDEVILPPNTNHENKKPLSKESREDLRAIYSEGRGDLRSFRDTFYQIVGILLAATVAVAVAGIQYIPILLVLVPPILAIVIMSSVGYLIWRGELIKSLSAIENLLGVDKDCAFERKTVEKGGDLPTFLKDRKFWLAVVLSLVMILVLEFLVVTHMPRCVIQIGVCPP